MPVRIESRLYELARSEAAVEKRTIAGQTEYWAMLGRVALDYPELPVTFVAASLASMSEPREQATQFTSSRAMDDFTSWAIPWMKA